VRRLSEQDAAQWENPDTARYLESLQHGSKDWPNELAGSRGDFATALLAATVYE
jgi:hypothetical protein